MSLFHKLLRGLPLVVVAVALAACGSKPTDSVPDYFKLAPAFMKKATWKSVSASGWTKAEAAMGDKIATFYIQDHKVYRYASMLAPSALYKHPFLMREAGLDSTVGRSSFSVDRSSEDSALPPTGLFIFEGSWQRPPVRFDITLPTSGNVAVSSNVHIPKIFVAFEAACAPCRSEIPALLQIAQATRGKVMVIIISPEDGEKVRQLFGDRGKADLTFVDDTPRSFYSALGLITVPHMYYQLASGKVAYVEDGPQSLGQMETQLAGILPSCNHGCRIVSKD